ncbi:MULTISPECIES: C40 family peptidase [unclassified Streptomyces]|uniref:C40 family peptidase n=1 Tax=unclassified Streptomyces TaxID=2593676 RepID=UPI00382CB161
MTMRMHVPNLLARAGIVSALTLTTVAGTTLAPGGSTGADAAAVSAKALRIAASKEGSPYQYGAIGPRRFDCSGLMLYSFRRAGKALPRTATGQYLRTRHVPAGSRRTGDLVFFHAGKGIYHVGIYAGSSQVWHAPKPGTVVRLEKIWSRSVSYGRVG